MRRLSMLLVILALLLPLPAQAQEIDCDAEELRPWLENYLAWRNAGADVFSLNSFSDDPIPFLLVLHDLQTQMDGPDRPACAESLMLETYRSFHRFEQASLCLRVMSTPCIERLDAAEGQIDVDELLDVYISASGLTDDEASALRPAEWDAAQYQASLGLAQNETSELTGMSSGAVTESQKGTRSNPYLSGEWVSFSEGRIRVMPVDSDYQTEYWMPPDGYRFMAVPLEYECYQEDENQSCSGSVGEAYVSPDGIVYEHTGVFDYPYIEAMEGYSGAILRGNLYFSVPANSELGQLRLDLDGEDVFFGLTAAE